MTSLPWMPWYNTRWLTSQTVAAMNIAQEGAYRRLLDIAWSDHACSLPADQDALMRLAKWNDYPEKEFAAVMACFVPHLKLDGRVVNKRLLDIWEESKQIQAHNSKVRKAAANKRWQSMRNATGKQKQSTSNANAMHPVTHNRTLHNKTEQKKKKEGKRRSTGVLDTSWVTELKADQTYQGIDVDRELGKAQVWCQTNHRTCTRRFFVNWLNRADRPILANRPIPLVCSHRTQQGQFLRPCKNPAQPGKALCAECEAAIQRIQRR